VEKERLNMGGEMVEGQIEYDEDVPEWDMDGDDAGAGDAGPFCTICNMNVEPDPFGSCPLCGSPIGQ